MYLSKYVLLSSFVSLLTISDAFAGCRIGVKETISDGDRIAIRACARNINSWDSFGMPREEWERINEYMAPAWQTRQCCMVAIYNATHEHQVDHEYCHDAQIIGWIERGACKYLLD